MTELLKSAFQKLLLKDDNSEDDTKINIIQMLLDRDLTRLCFDIFKNLDAASLTNCKLVCKTWKDFIDYHFYELPQGQIWIKDQIQKNILDDSYQPRLLKKHLDEEIYGIVSDEFSTCITTFSGSVINFELHTLDHIWTLKVHHNLLQHFMSQSKIYAVTSDLGDTAESHLFIIDRGAGTLIHTFENLHVYPMFGVRVFNDNIIATASLCLDNLAEGVIKFHKILDEDLKLIKDKVNLADGYVHLDCDGEIIVSGTTFGQLTAWKFANGEKLNTLETRQILQVIKVKWPYVITCTCDNMFEDFDKGIKVFNLEQELLVRHIQTFQYATDISIQNNLLMICGIRCGVGETYSKKTHAFMNWQDILNKDIKTENVSTNRIQFIDPEEPMYEKMNSSAMNGSDVITNEKKRYLVQRSYWP